MKKAIVLFSIVILILVGFVYFISEYTFIWRLKTIEEKVTNIESSVWRLEKWQVEILKKISEIQVKLLDLETSLSNVENQNKYTQYLVERNWLDMKYLAKVITDNDYYNGLVKLKEKYVVKKEIIEKLP